MSVHSNVVHVTFAVSRRRPLLAEVSVREFVFRSFFLVACRWGIDLISVAIECDHIHLVFDVPPSRSVSWCVCRFKSSSSRSARRWLSLGGSRFWQRRYFCRSVGSGDVKIVKKYVLSHSFARRVVGSEVFLP